jgi:protein gp37
VADRSGIEWTDATFNPWWGCSRVSPACAHCYADTLATRYGYSLWGEARSRRFLSDSHWKQPVLWNRRSAVQRRRTRVFCASMADVFEDHPELASERARLWRLIEETPNLDWQLLTKRIENVRPLVPWGDSWPNNVWLGVSVENSRFAYRVDLLRDTHAKVRFISAEPLLGDLFDDKRGRRAPLSLDGIDWVIAGGESGPGCRPTDLQWIRELRDVCQGTSTAFFLKQLGGHPDKRGKDKARLDGRLWRQFPFSVPGRNRYLKRSLVPAG